MRIWSQMLHGYQFVQLTVVKEKNFFRGQTVVVFRHCCILEPGFHFPTTDDVFTVKVVVFLQKLVQIHLFVFRRFGGTGDAFILFSLMLMISCLFALITPVYDIARIHVRRALLADVSTFVRINQAI
jgi:hypothetical protein